jgi:hypothetical protein
MIIAMTTALTTKLATRKVGFSRKAPIKPPLPPAACAACSATRTTNIPRRSFLTLERHLRRLFALYAVSIAARDLKM